VKKRSAGTNRASETSQEMLPTTLTSTLLLYFDINFVAVAYYFDINFVAAKLSNKVDVKVVDNRIKLSPGNHHSVQNI
jgi:hypothetical protein